MKQLDGSLMRSNFNEPELQVGPGFAGRFRAYIFGFGTKLVGPFTTLQ